MTVKIIPDQLDEEPDELEESDELDEDSDELDEELEPSLLKPIVIGPPNINQLFTKYDPHFMLLFRTNVLDVLTETIQIMHKVMDVMERELNKPYAPEPDLQTENC